MDAGTLTRIKEADWASIAPRLLRYVKNRIGDSVLPTGLTAEDVVQKAIERLFSPKGRQWNPEKQPDLYLYMRSVLQSMLSSKGLYGLKDDEVTEFIEEDRDIHLTRDGVKTGDCGERINALDRAGAFRLLEEEVRGDKELEDLLVAIHMGCTMPADMSELSGIPVRKIYELQRKLGRHAAKVAQQLSTGEVRTLP